MNLNDYGLPKVVNCNYQYIIIIHVKSIIGLEHKLTAFCLQTALITKIVDDVNLDHLIFV